MTVCYPDLSSISSGVTWAIKGSNLFVSRTHCTSKPKKATPFYTSWLKYSVVMGIRLSFYRREKWNAWTSVCFVSWINFHGKIWSWKNTFGFKAYFRFESYFCFQQVLGAVYMFMSKMLFYLFRICTANLEIGTANICAILKTPFFI